MKIMNILGSILLPLFVIMAQGCAQAGSAPAAHKSGVNHVSAGQQFDRMDANRDGRVILEEFSATYPNMNKQAFVIIDKNGDGAIQKPEWIQFLENHARGIVPRREDPNVPMNNIPGDPLIPPMDSSDLPLVSPPNG